ncbi:unnamed protein product [Paramecium sonneborni]|uniref:MORN repeat protein n=1 Tax=Paramecium sonneborni TaxID=65129 RepID=A0A8S1QRE6_9CILI|nr:unnamed protein product [Paramecium sonneborni]
MGIICANQNFESKKSNKIIKDQSLEAIDSMKIKSRQFKCLCFDSFQQRWLTKEYLLKLDKRIEIIDVYDGQILRLNRKFSALNDEVFDNLEQIKYLQWVGKYGKNLQKIAKWTVDWNGQILQTIGGYYSESGQKIGIWKDLFKNYCSHVPVFQEGEYYSEKKLGRWIYIYKNTRIGGGVYKEGLKTGKWIELDEGFFNSKQVTYKGEYNQKGMKVGIWDIWFNCGLNKYMQNICKYNVYSGGGQYDQEGNQKKIGKWVELFEGFQKYAQITYNGEYNIHGIKVGRWDIIRFRDWMQTLYKYKEIYSGGGLYDQEGSQKKIGKWIELDEGFWDVKQVIYNGEYNMNGLKIGRWDVKFRYCSQEPFKQIGGGLYDQEGNQKKIGKWIELDEGFTNSKQVTHNGEYNINGRKIGIWMDMDIKNNRTREEVEYDY